MSTIITVPAPTPTDRYVLLSPEDYSVLKKSFLLGQRIEFADIHEGTPARGVFEGIVGGVSIYVTTYAQSWPAYSSGSPAAA